MATYFVDSTASGTNSGADWTNAFISFASLPGAMTVDGDVAKVSHTHQEQGADSTYSFTNSVAIICVDKASGDAQTAMGTGGWLGHSTNPVSTTFNVAAGKSLYTYGLTVRLVGSTVDSIWWAGATDGTDITHESAYAWSTNTNAGSRINAGGAGSNVNTFVHLKNYSHQGNHANQGLTCSGAVIWEGGSIVATGTVPGSAIQFAQGSSHQTLIGVDLSYLGSNPIVASNANQTSTTKIIQCKLGTSYSVLATQSITNRSSAEAWLLDCHSGDTHGIFGHYNALGSTVSNTSIYVTSSPSSGMSWEISGTTAATRYTPYYSPWISVYNSDVATSITPRIEILRNDGTTARTDAEVWGEFTAKNTTGSTQASFFTDRATVLASGTNQDTGTGLGNWTGESGTAWSGKVDSGAAFTPDEVGDIRGRVVVGGNFTVYAEPVIRGIAALA